MARATSGTPVTGKKGIWFGMSGSPDVYTLDPEGDPEALVGAVAFGLAWDGTSTLAGLQPAYQMEEVRRYSATTAQVSAVTLSSTGAQKVAASTGMPTAQVQRFEQLAIPLALPGSGQRLNLVRRAAERAGLRVVPVATGASTSAAAAAIPAELAAGDTFAAALSYGYLTAAAIGTTTYTCGDFAMAFGHPFFFSGRTGRPGSRRRNPRGTRALRSAGRRQNEGERPRHRRPRPPGSQRRRRLRRGALPDVDPHTERRARPAPRPSVNSSTRWPARRATTCSRHA
ncbi:MAG: hypothetical protein GEU74_02780 [Nitriliruptorales bacterium]|nr:hypothetical protein [Nitriliruptorales bacterium]